MIRILLIGFLSSLFILFAGCDSSQNTSKKELSSSSHICSQCNMPIAKTHKEYTAVLSTEHSHEYFDDPGCMILWVKENNTDINEVDLKVYTNDTSKYIDAKNAFYAFDELTPMNYGFGAYKNKAENLIDFKQMRLRMLRGEHIANPKIRKQILGY